MNLLVGIVIVAFAVYAGATQLLWRDAHRKAAERDSLIRSLKSANAEQAKLIDLLLHEAQPMAAWPASARQMATRH